MKKLLICLLLCLFVIPCVSVDGVRLYFPRGTTTYFGITPKMPNQDRMHSFALEQASIFATKLDSSFCIFRLAAIDETFADTESSDYAVFIVNVIAEWDHLYTYLDNLIHIGRYDYKGYDIYFFNFVEKTPCIVVSTESFEIELTEPFIEVWGNTVTSTATARHRNLDDAVDEAFKLALSEISKYQDMNVKSMHRGIEYYSELATLITSENVVSEVSFSQVDFLYDIRSHIGVYHVKVSLVKAIQTE